MIRRVACLVPYCRKKGELCFFLQKRAKDAKMYPGVFSLWGGGIEKSESVEEALVREIKEELEYDLEKFSFLETSTDDELEEHDFYAEVRDDFDEKVKINEGEYGKWFTMRDIKAEKDILDSDKELIARLSEKLGNGK